MFDEIDTDRLARTALRHVVKSPYACRAVAEALEIQQDGSEDVTEYVTEALADWVRRSEIRTHERRIKSLTIGESE